nr:MAG TPA: hypothetical protein [Caudoviricetes sp.]
MLVFFTLYRLKVAIYMVFMGLFPVSLSLWVCIAHS